MRPLRAVCSGGLNLDQHRLPVDLLSHLIPISTDIQLVATDAAGNAVTPSASAVYYGCWFVGGAAIKGLYADLGPKPNRLAD